MIRVNPTELSGAFSTQAKFADEAELLNRLVAQAALSPAARATTSAMNPSYSALRPSIWYAASATRPSPR